MIYNRYYHYTTVALATFCWSASFSVVRDLVTNGCDPNMVSVLRSFLSTLFFLLMILVQKRPIHFQDLKTHAGLLIGMGIFGVFFAYLLANVGLQYETAGKSALIYSISPVTIILFSALIFKEPMTKRRIWGTVVSFIGVVIVIFADNQGLWYQLDFHPQDLLFLAAGLSATVYTILNRLLGDRMDYAVGLFWPYLLGSLLLLPLAFPYLSEIVHYSLKQWLELLFLGAICGTAGNFAWYQAVMVIGTGNAGLINSLSPLFAVIIAWVSLGEQITLPLILGALLLVYGIWRGVSALPVGYDNRKNGEGILPEKDAG